MGEYENYKLKWEMASDAVDRKNEQIYKLSKEIEHLKINTIPKEFGTGELLTQINELQEENREIEKRIQIVKDLGKAELISYLETILETTSCENTKKYIQIVLLERRINNTFEYENMIEVMKQGTHRTESGEEFILVEGIKYYVKYYDDGRIYFTDYK